MRSTILFLIGMLTALAVSLTSAKAAQSELKIGVMLCLTGDCAEWGTNGLRGAELAAAELNEKGGVLGRTVKLVVEDSRDTTPSASVSAYRKLTEEPDVHYIVGPTWSVGGMPIAPLVAKKQDLIITSPSVGLKEFNEYSANIYNTWQHDEVATRAIAKYSTEQGWRTAAVFGCQDPFYVTQSQIFEQEFTARGGRVVAKVEPLADSRELKTEAMRIKAANPDFVVLTNYQADVITKELAAIKFTKPVVAVQLEKKRVKEAGGTLNGVVFAMYEKPAPDFTAKFKKRYGEEPGISSDTAYDAVMVYAKAVAQAGTDDTQAVRKVLAETRNFSGASGTFSFNEKRAVDKQPVLWRVRGLDYERVSPAESEYARGRLGAR